MVVSIEQLLDTKGKVLGVDFGDTRTGLAVSDISRFLASGIGMISPGGIEKTAAKVSEIAKEQNAVAIVIGLPKNMDGSEGFRAERVKQFANLVSENAPQCFITMMDERLTTKNAMVYLNETNTRGKKRKEVIDTLSAQIILQNALDRLKNLKR